MKFDKVSFATQLPLPSSMRKQQKNRKEKMGTSKALEHINTGEPSSPLYCYSLKAPETPQEAMEFLSRSWSESSINFFEIFTLASKHFSQKSMLPPISEEDDGNVLDNTSFVKDDEEERENEEKKWTKIHNRNHISILVEDIKMLLSTGRSLHQAIQRQNPEKKTWMNVNSVKKRLTEAMGKLSIECKEKRRNETRMHRAQVHAALSVAGVAAAVAGFAARSNLSETSSSSSSNNNASKESLAMASATALVAAACAEAAERAGAPRAHVSSVVRSALAAPTPTDVDALTAAAATCLRGAAILKSRITISNDISNSLSVLTKGTQLRVCVSPEKSHLKMVQVYLKHNVPFLRLGTKYLRGFLSRSKEYRIKDVIEDPSKGNKVEGLYLLTLMTARGAKQILFEDEKQCNVWGSTITRLLANQAQFSPINS